MAALEGRVSSPTQGSSTANKQLALMAMICAVSMTFIDQTIVSIAVPDLQTDLKLSESGVQWVVNGYLVALAALFALGGRVADIAGHRRVVLIGIAIFAVASAMCGATPDGSLAEAWMITWRVIQGAGAALMFPAALGIVVAAYPREERGKAMATFFGIAGAMTALGPLAGGLSDRDQLALHLLDQRSGCSRRHRSHAACQAGRHAPSGLTRPEGGAARRRRCGCAGAGVATGQRLGLEQPGHDRAIAGGIVLLVVFRRRGARHGRTADPGADLLEPGLRSRQPGAVPDLHRLRARCSCSRACTARSRWDSARATPGSTSASSSSGS
jgi:hypothetical protein